MENKKLHKIKPKRYGSVEHTKCMNTTSPRLIHLKQFKTNSGWCWCGVRFHNMFFFYHKELLITNTSVGTCWNVSKKRCSRDAAISERDNGEGIKVCHSRKLEFLQKSVPQSFRPLFSLFTFFEASLICWLRNGWNQQSPTKVLLLFKLIHIMDDHKLTNHSTEVKRRMPSACYLAKDVSLLCSPHVGNVRRPGDRRNVKFSF